MKNKRIHIEISIMDREDDTSISKGFIGRTDDKTFMPKIDEAIAFLQKLKGA